MTREEKIAREYLEIAELRKRSMFSVPINPSDAGMSPEEIKEHTYGGEFYLYKLLKGLREFTENLEEEVHTIEQEGVAKFDSDLNIIVDTYVTKDLSMIAEEIQPLEMTIEEQSQAYMYIDNNGTPAKVSINNLDYSKVVTTNDEDTDKDNIRNKDYLFVED